MKMLFAFWLAALRTHLLKLLIKKDGCVFESIFTCIRRTGLVWFVVNFIFYTVEKAVFSRAFSHFGDVILISYLAFQLGACIVLLINIRVSMNTRSYFNC